ncbi:MAG: hypothetical protein AVDCRST_MAG68-3076, partial [uncultured Gemmatimonadetes bacterium]
ERLRTLRRAPRPPPYPGGGPHHRGRPVAPGVPPRRGAARARSAGAVRGPVPRAGHARRPVHAVRPALRRVLRQRGDARPRAPALVELEGRRRGVHARSGV